MQNLQRHDQERNARLLHDGQGGVRQARRLVGNAGQTAEGAEVPQGGQPVGPPEPPLVPLVILIMNHCGQLNVFVVEHPVGGDLLLHGMTA